MQTQLRAWGNSQAVRLKKEILDAAGFLPEEKLEIQVFEGKIVLSKTFRHKSLEERAAEYGGKLLLGGELDYGDPLGRELW